MSTSVLQRFVNAIAKDEASLCSAETDLTFLSLHEELKKMKFRTGGLTILVLILVCHLTGLLMFCKGFLLKRVVIPEYNQCARNVTESPSVRANKEDGPHGHSCNGYPRPFRRVVWLLIDALRYDFALFDDTLEPAPVYRNKMPFVRDLLRDRPQNAKLFRFVADPPTTTMQRLKALTTGGLPTFVDFGYNFNSYEIMEDSLPYQANAIGQNVTFIGDDTWLGLYPNMLTKVFAYPSLNVKDFHTVDNGVITHMVPELEKHDAEFVIGHLLGVDHVGHTYGPYHWTMGEKLAQMNEFLKSVFAAVDNDTIVFVFGDHGMTTTGDHGGETVLETDAALLVYTPRPHFDPRQPSGRSVYQTDLVPTVAFSLGIPVPFSSLGMVIPEVFLPHLPDSTHHQADRETPDVNGYGGRVTPEFLTALKINAEQLQLYLATYVQYSDDFPSKVFQLLEEKLSHAKQLHEAVQIQRDGRITQEDLTDAASAYVQYMKDVKAMCQSVWAKFDDTSINKGLFLLTLSVCMTIVSFLDIEQSIRSMTKLAPTGFSIGTVLSLGSILVERNQLELSFNGLILVLMPLFFYSLTIISLLYLWNAIHKSLNRLKFVVSWWNISSFIGRVSFVNALAIVVTLLYSVSLLSNSFIVYESDMVVFFVQTMAVCLAMGKLRREFLESKQQKNTTQHLRKRILKTLAPFVLFMLCVRATKLFHSCRDSQDGCEPTTFILALPTASEFLGGALAKCRFLVSCLAVGSVPLTLAMFLNRNRATRLLNAWLVTGVRFGYPAAVLCMAGFWGIQALSQSRLEALPHWQHVILPRAVYCIAITAIGICMVKPFKKHTKTLVCEDSSMPDTYMDEVETARTVPLTEVNKQSTRSRKPDVIYASSDPPPQNLGLIGPQPSTLTTLILSILLVGVWIPTAMLLNDGIALSSVLMVAQVALFITSLEQSKEGTFALCVFWGLICCQFFFGFGHQATVTSLRFEAAFVGMHGAVTGATLPLAGLLVGLNTLASHILFGLGLPLLLLQRVDGTSSRGLLTVGLYYIGFHSLKLLVSALGASIHRRHLMVWAVFGPRFLYEGAFQATTDFCVIIAHVVLWRLENH